MVKTSRDVISKSTKPVPPSPALVAVVVAVVAVIAVAVAAAAAVTAAIAVAVVVVATVAAADVAVATEIVVAAAAAAAIAVNPTLPFPRFSIMRQGQSARAAPGCFRGLARRMKGRSSERDQAGRASAGVLGLAVSLRVRRKHRARMMSSRLNPMKLQRA